MTMLSVAQAADQAGCGLQAIYKAIREGRLVASRDPSYPRRHLIDTSDLRAWRGRITDRQLAYLTAFDACFRRPTVLACELADIALADMRAEAREAA